ncbi:MAG: hypothetical protein IJW92_08675 [Clostridia bacterium]|nr:hypothetical protein [Clostridia bacterium]
MTRSAFLKKYLLKLAVTLAMLGLIVYTVAHAFGNTSGSLGTTPVRYITDTVITSAQTYLFREESVLTVPEAGLVNTLAESGEKVGKNVSLAAVYSSNADAETLEAQQQTLNRLNRAIRILEDSEVAAGTTVSHAELYRANAAQYYAEICRSVTEGDYFGITELETEFSVMLNRYAVLTGKESLTEILQELKSERDALLAGSSTVLRSTESSGIFYDSTYVDGYEELFTLKALEELSADSFAALKSAEPKETEQFSVGKMVYGYSWYLAMELENSEAEHFTVGERYEVCFPENQDRTLSMTLTDAIAGDGTTVLVLRSDDNPSDFVYYRSQPAEIVRETVKGFYIQDSALQNLNGTDGVYVFEESTVRFRRIEILYRGDGYCIAALPSDSESAELEENDILVTSGKNLYDGKVYQ